MIAGRDSASFAPDEDRRTGEASSIPTSFNAIPPLATDGATPRGTARRQDYDTQCTKQVIIRSPTPLPAGRETRDDELVRKCRSQPRPGVFEGLGKDAGVGGGGHEIGVARPSRDDMEVEMPEDAGTARPALIDAQVEPVRIDDEFEGRLRPG